MNSNPVFPFLAMILEMPEQEVWFSASGVSELTLLVDSLTQPIKTKHCYSNR